MLVRLILAAVLIPLVELVLLDELSDQIGMTGTVGLILVTGAIGATLARRQGRSVWRQIHNQLQQGQSPSREITEGVIILLAGALLLTPGLLTDGLGFLMLVPPLRSTAARWLTRWFLKRTSVQFRSVTPPRRPPPGEHESSGASVRVVDPAEHSRLD